MSIETLLLSAWEEEGYVGRTRVARDKSDIDVLAIHPGRRVVRIGEAKVTSTALNVYVLDPRHVELLESGQEDFTEWLEEGWSRWLSNLPELWSADGRPTVPWLLAADQLAEVQVFFCAPIYVIGDRGKAEEAFGHVIRRYLALNAALDARLNNGGLTVLPVLKSTVEVLFDLIVSVCNTINDGYARRFGNLVKDTLREMHRYLHASLYRLPRDSQGQPIPHIEAEIRKATALGLLGALGIDRSDL